jgi:hypothetical protein
MPPFFLAAIRDTKTKKAFLGKTRIDKTRGPNAFGAPQAR